MSMAAIGLGLFAWGVILRFQLEKEVKKGKTVLWNNFLPYWNHNDFTEKGNQIRKSYNKTYFVFIFYIIILFFLKQYYAQ